MTAFHTAIVDRRCRAALRLLAAGALAGLLAGCYQTQVAQHSEYPNDYRQRHPITLKEGDRTVEVFLGRNRGGLNPSQRADVLSFAQLWRREATSGKNDWCCCILEPRRLRGTKAFERTRVRTGIVYDCDAVGWNIDNRRKIGTCCRRNAYNSVRSRVEQGN